MQPSFPDVLETANPSAAAVAEATADGVAPAECTPSAGQSASDGPGCNPLPAKVAPPAGWRLGILLRAVVGVLFVAPLCFLLAPEAPKGDRAAGPPPAVKPLVDDGAKLPAADDMERLAKDDPVAFLEKTLLRYEREVKGYNCTLKRQERVNGKLLPSEVIDVAFREKPFSVRLEWAAEPRPARAILLVEGENADKLVVQPTSLWSPDLDPKGSFAMARCRYPMTEFGMKKGMENTRAYWIAARDAKALHVEYLGVKKPVELAGRPCYCLKRTRYAKPEVDGITEVTYYFDKETWLQVGSVLKGEEGQLIGEYFFRDVKLNPEFKDDAFSRKAIGK
jgi:hypothetical protein